MKMLDRFKHHMNDNTYIKLNDQLSQVRLTNGLAHAPNAAAPRTSLARAEAWGLAGATALRSEDGGFGAGRDGIDQWVGLSENLQETIDFPMKYEIIIDDNSG